MGDKTFQSFPDPFLTNMPEKLTDEMRTFVVQSLACFDHPSEVAASVAREFGVEITRQSIQAYDPTTVAGAVLSERWRALFHETRRAFLASTAGIGISHRPVRLRRMERLAQNAERLGLFNVAARLLEQAARECGDVYSKKPRLALKVAEDQIALARRKESRLPRPVQTARECDQRAQAAPMAREKETET